MLFDICTPNHVSAGQKDDVPKQDVKLSALPDTLSAMPMAAPMNGRREHRAASGRTERQAIGQHSAVEQRLPRARPGARVRDRPARVRHPRTGRGWSGRCPRCAELPRGRVLPRPEPDPVQVGEDSLPRAAEVPPGLPRRAAANNSLPCSRRHWSVTFLERVADVMARADSERVVQSK